MSFLGNTSTSPFGASKLGGVFGGQTPQQQGTTTTNLFGGSTPSGGTGTSSIFGGGTTNQFGFGGNTSTNGVGAFSGVFGSASKPAAASTGLFGGTTTTMGFGSSQAAGTSVPFEAAEDTDVISKNGVQSQVRVKYQNITLMNQYKTFEKSLEELRLEDYQLNRHKKNTLGLFGTSGAAPSAPTPPAASGGFFGSGVFGASNAAATTPTTTAFVLGGTSSRFGQQTTSSSAATTTGSAFGGTGLFGSQQNKPVGGLFGSGTTTTGAFGGTTGGTSSTPFTFGTAATTASTQPTTNLFGQSTQQQQGTNSGFTFGQPSTTSAFGTSSIFGGQTSQQQPTFGSFTQQQQQPATTTNWFGNTSTATTTPAAKPLFGGTGSVFGSSSTSTSQPQNNSFFSVPTSTTTSSTAPVFGSTGSGGTATIGLFGNATQQQAQQQSKFFAFPSTNTTSSSFGGFGGTTTAPQTTTPSFGFGSAFQSQPQQPSTGIPGFQPTFGAPAQPSTGFNFSMTSQEQQQPYYPYINPMSNYYMPLYYAPGPVAFATTAYKDNPIFYNLLQNHPIPQSSSRKKREEVNSLESATLLPTASRRMRFSGSGPSAFGSFNLSKSPAVKKLTRYNTSKGSKQHNSLTKFKLFDGFEEEDFGVGINILSPKCSVKKLDLSALKHPLLQINLNHGDKDMGMAQRSQEILRRKEVELEASSSNSFEHYSPLLQRTRKVRFNLPEDDRLREESDAGSVSVILPPDENRGGLRRMGMMNGGGDASSSSSVATVELGIRKEEEEDQGNSSVEKVTIPGEKCGVINTRLDYWLKPGLRELDQMVDGQGYCVVIGLEIGRRQYGRIKFLCPVNIAGQNIDKLVHFRHKEVVVYPNDNDKPDLGQGLNVPAEIQLERVWPVDQDNNELIRDPDNAKLQQYEAKLRRACKRMEAEFVSYSGEEGRWVFRVTHF